MNIEAEKPTIDCSNLPELVERKILESPTFGNIFTNETMKAGSVGQEDFTRRFKEYLDSPNFQRDRRIKG